MIIERQHIFAELVEPPAPDFFAQQLRDVEFQIRYWLVHVHHHPSARALTDAAL
jgi:hypothetical protein